MIQTYTLLIYYLNCACDPGPQRWCLLVEWLHPFKGSLLAYVWVYVSYPNHIIDLWRVISMRIEQADFHWSLVAAVNEADKAEFKVAFSPVLNRWDLK